MYEIYPYITNDGSVGLFSPGDDDIYHSTCGALSESWQKFIFPSHLVEYISAHKRVKILDICYGIGYNSKTALQVFLNEVSKNNKNKVLKKYSKITKSSSYNVEAIYTDNIYDPKIKANKNMSIESIGSDNISSKINDDEDEILSQKENSPNYCSESIYSDNVEIQNASLFSKINNETYNSSVKFDDKTSDSSDVDKRKQILIDAVDTDNILIELSPFISRGIKNNKFFHEYIIDKYHRLRSPQDKITQIKKMQKSKLVKLDKCLEIDQEVLIIILKKLLESNLNLENDIIFNSILSKNKFYPFFDKFMINLAKFYANKGYNSNLKKNKMAFLHNIYYRYISKSYKKALKMLSDSKIDLNFHNQDARAFVMHSESTYNFIFLDAFTPAKCPNLWSLEFFKELYSKLDDDGMILTYSNSAAVRGAFLHNGFYVGKIYDKSINKFIGTVATKDPRLIEYKLDNRDIDLINSKAGICYRDENLNLNNEAILKNREIEVENSNLVSSSKVMKGYKNNVKQL